MSSRALFFLGFLAFLLIGALQAVYGPTFLAFRERFGVTPDTVGLIASAHFLGSMIGIVAAGLVQRHGLRASLRVGAALLTSGLALVAFVPAWAFALGGALLGGVGFGFVSVTFNVGFARLGDRAAGLLNLLNACFGLGSVAAPLLVTFVGGVWSFGTLAVVAVLLLLGSGRLPEVPEHDTPRMERQASPTLLGAFGVLFALYVGVEAGVGSWITTHLHASGVAGAAGWTSAFWLTVTLGRLLAVPLAMRVAPPALVVGCASLAALAMPITATTAAPVGYLLVGLSIAPLFGTLLAWFTRVLPTRLVPVALACGSLGGTLFPALLGALVGEYGVAVLPLAFTGTALSFLVAALVVQARQEVMRVLA